MPTDAQLRANRANAQKSTGPRTAAGKERSRCNATTHNITGLASLRSGPEQTAFDAYFARLLPTFDATTDLELELARRIVDVMFRLARISVLETNLLALPDLSATDRTDPDDPTAHAIAIAQNFLRESRTFTNLSLYEQRLSRTLQKDLDTLRRLRPQKPQNGAAATPTRPDVLRWVSDGPNPVDTLPPLHLTPRDAARAHSQDREPAARGKAEATSAQAATRAAVVRGKEIGFVFSNPQSHAAPPGFTA